MQCTLSVLLGQASVFQFQGNVLSHLISTLFDWLSCPFKLPPLAPLHFMCEWCCKVTWWWASLRIHSYGSFFSFLFLFLFFFFFGRCCILGVASPLPTSRSSSSRATQVCDILDLCLRGAKVWLAFLCH